MKKLNKKGFTLIELLAVITIMGILMIVAIPAISRTIENSRRDTFLDTAKQYASSVKTLWAADGITCGSVDSSAVAAGYYYIKIDSSSTKLLESGGKSAWGNKDVKGYVLVNVESESIVKFSVALADAAGHGISEPTNTDNIIEYLDLKRANVEVADVNQAVSPTIVDPETNHPISLTACTVS